ncbi:MAG: type II toxin-antitoxin system RelE family toxin [Longimicrobiales bacterium]
MASYRVFIKPSAVKELVQIPLKDRKRLARRIEALAEDPRPPGCEKLSGQERYRIRQGQYRVIYGIEDDHLIVLVVRVAHRRDVYR